jgi:hypothetical protein
VSSTSQEGGPGPFAFQVSRGDLGPLFVDTLRLRCNPLSPLARDLGGYAPGSAAPSDDLVDVSEHPLFPKVARILARPGICFTHRTGGGSTPVSHFTACYNREIDGQAVAVATPSFEGSLLIQLFDTPSDYLAWWLGLIGTKVEEPTANCLPQPVRLESLVYLLHAIDAYRRASFESMLSYAPADQLFLRAADFTDSMSRSIRSADVRWLLPAFLHLTPNLDVSNFDPQPEHLTALAERDFLALGKERETQEDVLVFGEAGMAMGVEFYRTWMMAIGFEATALTARGERVLHRAFLAPTAIANHLVLLESADDGCVATHEALTFSELAAKLAELLKAAIAEPTVSGIPEREEPAPAAAGTAEPVCPACNATVLAGARFCPSCGKPLPKPEPPKPVLAFCPRCGAKVKPGARFCGGCGAVLA